MPTLRERIAEAASRVQEGRASAPGSAEHRVDLRNCAPCKKKPIDSRKSADYSVSVCFSAANENDYIVPTIASVKCDCPRAEILGVDDVSAKPQPGCRIRAGRRMGVSGARRIAAQLAGGDVIVVMDPHIALDSESAQAIWRIALAESERAGRKLNTPAVPASPCAALDAMKNKLDALARLALEHRAVVYPRCWSLWASHNGARFRVDGGLRRHIWRLKAPTSDPEPTSCCLGGLYAMPRELLEAFGGWPKLPAPYSGDEETLATLAIAHGVPVLLAPNIAIWHLFRGHSSNMIPVPFEFGGEAYRHNCAATYRLMLDDEHWREFRPMLGSPFEWTESDGKRKTRDAIEEVWLKDVEGDDFTRYRDSVQKNFKLSTDEILAELDRRMMADLQPGEKP
jgi:hypothetical protein